MLQYSKRARAHKDWGLGFRYTAATYCSMTRCGAFSKLGVISFENPSITDPIWGIPFFGSQIF